MPPVLTREVLVKDGYLLAGPGRRVTLVEDELYLRKLWSLALAGPQHHLIFVGRHGLFADPGCELLPLEKYPALRKSLEKVRLKESAEPVESGWTRVHGDEVMYYARALRDMTRIYRAWHSEYGIPGSLMGDDYEWRWESTWMKSPETEMEALSFLADFLDAGLRPFSLRAWIRDNHAPKMPEDLHSPGLFSALCLQLAKHIDEGTLIRRCRNGLCANLFVRRQGPAEKGQRWSKGVKYCSQQCAKRQADRISKAGAKSRTNQPGGVSD